MKKTLLLFLFLLPFWGIAQNIDFVQWNGSTDLAPTILNNYIDASYVTGAGFSNGNPTPTNDGIEGTNWPTANAIDLTKYFQITLNPILDGRILLNEIQFNYKGNTRGYQVRYSKQADFSSPVTLVTVTNGATNNTPTSGNLSGLNIALNAGERIYIRFYAYDGGGTWKIMNNNILKLRGTIVQNPSPMNGNYIVGSAAGASFGILTSAVRALNTVGVSGTVNILLDNTSYNVNTGEVFPLVINPYTGNTSYKVTFKPNTGRTVSIESSNSSKNTETVFKLNGVDNVVFDGSNTLNGTTKDLTIYNNNQSNNSRSVIWIASENNSNGANGNEVKNLILQQYSRGSYDYSIGVFGGGTSSVTSVAQTANSNNIVSNVTFAGMGQAVYLNGLASSLSTGWKIQNNIIGGTTNSNKPYVGVSLNNAKDYEVSRNNISGLYKSDSQTTTFHHAGVSVYGTSNGVIFGNKISDIYDITTNSYCAGIYLDSGNNSVYNNFINNIRTSATDDNNYNFDYKGHGIYIKSGASNKIYYNTISMDASTAGGRASCLFIAGGSVLDVRNNIFYNTQTTGTQYTIFTRVNSSVFTLLSNNNHYIAKYTSRFNARLEDNPDYTTLANWQAVSATGKDSNSQTVAPSFVSSSDFHLQNISTNNTLTGTAISGITIDIDGDTRVKPYMGADELVVCTPSGDQTTPGINSWIGYVYSWTGTAYPNPATPTTLPVSATSTYIGTVTENALFDRNVTSGQVNGVTRNIPCDTPPSDKFFVRYKMQTTTAAGRYNFTIGGDDGVRLYVDGSLVTVAPTGSYGVHSYNTYAAQVDLTAGTHNFILEYFENDGDSRVSFSYGQIQGNVALPFGDNKWNVYGFTVANINLPSYAYAGMYVDNNVNVNTQTSWGRTSSPSAASSWLGAPVGVDQFTITYKRQGFPCGRYQIQLVNCDDVGEIYVDGTKVFTQNGYTGTSAIINGGTTYLLNKNSTVEIRLREDGGDANIAVNFIDTPTVYNGSGTLASDTSIRISANTTLGSDLQVCSCTVDTGVTFTIPANRTLTVDETINVAGTGKLLIQNNGSLLQKNTTAAAYTGAVTSFEMQRNTAPVRRYDFSYWSSPVTLASNFTLYKLSPNTLGDKYYSYNPNSGWAINYNGTQVMTPGQGYIVRAPQSYDINSTAVYTASFIGVPNNGDVTITPVGGQWNLIGNPYPSALDAQKLMTANNNVGSLYFWTHNSPPSNTVSGDATYNYTSNDYAVYNFSGGVATSSGAAAPSGYIAAGQSFFINASSSNNIVFTNDMRVGGNNTQFFKTAKAAEEVERNRLWLNFTNTQGAFKQALVGYIEGATNSLDNGFDAETMAGNSYVDFYSINDALQLTIQGRALPFENSDIIPLGYNTSIAGDFTISIDHVDGVFNDQAVYLEDKKTSTIYDLKTGDYTFKTEAGTFDDRFTLRYTNKTLGTGDFENVDNGLLVSVKDKVIKVTSNKENIKSTAIYDISGRLIYDKNKVGTTELQISNLQSADQVLLVKIILENNYTLTKKIIFK